MTKRRRDVLNMFAAVWGTAGLSGVLIFAIYRLGRISLTTRNTTPPSASVVATTKG
jgi:hypothetical protein